MDLLFTAFAVLLFAAVIFMVEGAWLWWSTSHGRGARRIARRLDLMAGQAEAAAERISILKQRRYAASPALEQWLRRIPRLDTLDRLLQQAGVSWQVAQFLGGAMALFIAALLLACLSLPLPAAFMLLGSALAAPYFLLTGLRSSRLKKIEGQLPEAADFLARALRAGHSFANVLKMVSDEVAEPIGGEFKITYEEVNYGVPLNDALHNLATRIPLTDLRYFVLAVLIQRESGGNLAELLGNIARLTRARLKLQDQIRVMSAEGRMSAWVLAILPLAIMALLSVLNYRYICVLWTTEIGIALMWFAAGSMAVGALWMRKLVRIRV